MDAQLFERLLYRGESETLDFKVDQYSFERAATEDERSELLKDILAFANAWREEEAFILIGVAEGQGGKANALGIAKHLEDAALHQFTDSKTQRPVKFSHERFLFEGKSFGIVRVPLQARPLFAPKKYGKIEAGAVYVRRGSATAIATPDEIEEMAMHIHRRLPQFKIHAQITRSVNVTSPQLALVAHLRNEGIATACEVQIEVEREPVRSRNYDHRLWNERSVSSNSFSLASMYPIHPGGMQFISAWPLYPLTPNGSDRPEIDMRVKVLARDQNPVVIAVRFSPREIEPGTIKEFAPD